MMRTSLILIYTLLLTCVVHADEKIFDYDKQKAAGKDIKKLVFIGDAGTHGARGNHEFVAGFILMARSLNDAYSNVHAVVHSTKAWPKDLSHADVIIVGPHQLADKGMIHVERLRQVPNQIAKKFFAGRSRHPFGNVVDRCLRPSALGDVPRDTVDGNNLSVLAHDR